MITERTITPLQEEENKQFLILLQNFFAEGHASDHVKTINEALISFIKESKEHDRYTEMHLINTVYGIQKIQEFIVSLQEQCERIGINDKLRAAS